jgi:DNA-binding MarR family transcriptional regulator
MVTSGAMTNRLDRLESRRLVRRRRDPADGRSIRVRLSALGQRRVDGALRDLVVREAAILGALEPHEQATIARLLRRVTSPFDD